MPRTAQPELEAEDTDFRVPVTPGQPAPLALVNDDELEESEDDIVSRLRKQIGGEPVDKLRVRLYRRHEGQSALEFCREYSIGDFEAGQLELVRKEWGPGNYHLRLIGSKGIAMREDFRVAAALSNPLPVAVPDPSHQFAQQMAPLAAVLQTLAEGQNRIVEALSQRPDPAAELQRTLGLMTAMREAMGLNAAPVAAPATNPTSMLTEIVGAIRQLREVSDEINPKAPDADNPLSMLPGIVDLVKTAVASRGGQSQQMELPLAMPASIATAAPPETVEQIPTGQASEVDMQTLILKGLIQGLFDLAEAGKPATEGGAYVAEKLPDDLFQYLELPNWADIFKMVLPNLDPAFAALFDKHRAWLTEARAEALRLDSTAED